jgi:phosphoglycerol transferase MdoB-like AlkP superfamily enzyme
MAINNKLSEWRVPKTVQWLVRVFILYFFIFTGFRVATIFFFRPAGVGLLELLPACWLGMKYDLRWIAIILSPIAVFSLYPKFSPFHGEAQKKFWTFYLGFLTLLVFFFYGADFGQFAYVNARLNADALIFAEDPVESLQMVWQSYPLVWILIGLTAAVLVMTRMFRRIHVGIEDKNSHIHKFTYKRRYHVAALLTLVWFMYGFFTREPLDFYRAFRFNDEFKSNLALNPLQNFFTTLGFREVDHHTRAHEYYPVIRKFLGVEDQKQIHRYARTLHPGSKALENRPNIVLVICESLSMYKTSMSGNKLNPTPYLSSLCEEGIFFERCFSPSFGTARGVFAILSGVPDVQLSKFSSRNEASVRQRTIINDFEGYNKYYFLGGRSQFNNFSGMIKNIRGVSLFEKGNYSSPDFNVWGISDNNLFKEADQVMRKSADPFFAIIQTADNHRPYEIPEEDRVFPINNYSKDSLKANGFDSQEEFNAMCYMDYCIRKFMERASEQPYYKNTIFVFVGDHGVEGNASAMYPKAWTENRLSDEHIPLLIYAPGMLEPELHPEVVSQIDILPTIAGLLQQPYTNHTLGRDLLDSEKSENAAFIIQHAGGWIGLVSDDYFYRRSIRMNKEEVVPVRFGIQVPIEKKDSICRHMSELSQAIYETSRWMLINNH